MTRAKLPVCAAAGRARVASWTMSAAASPLVVAFDQGRAADERAGLAAASRQSSEPATTTPCSATAPRRRSAPSTTQDDRPLRRAELERAVERGVAFDGEEAARPRRPRRRSRPRSRRRRRRGVAAGCARQAARSMPNQRAKKRSARSAAELRVAGDERAVERRAGRRAQAQGVAGDAAAGVDRRCRRRPRRGCARRARRRRRRRRRRPSAPPTGAARRPGDQAERDLDRAAASWPAFDAAAQAAPRRVQPVRSRGRCPAARRRRTRARSPARSRCRAGRRRRRAPLAGQRHDQPSSPRTQAACSGRGVPASSQVAATKPAPSSTQVARRETTGRAGSALGRQSSPIGVLSLSRASAHSSPASAASNDWVERYWLAEARVSTTALRLATATTISIANTSSIVTTSAAAPRWRRTGGGAAAAHSGLAAADDRAVAQPRPGCTLRRTPRIGDGPGGDRDGEAAHLLPRRAGRAAGRRRARRRSARGSSPRCAARPRRR